MIRSFIAIELPQTVRGGIESLTLELKKAQAAVGWVRPQSVHLTLKFLGSVAPDVIERIKPVLGAIGANAAPFCVQAAGCGAFPDTRQPRVIWVGLRGDLDPLVRLQREIESEMAPFGFAPEDRPFRPHLTLKRVKGRQGLFALSQLLQACGEFAAEPFDVTGLVLYKSELRPDGARYTPLFKAPFSGRPA